MTATLPGAGGSGGQGGRDAPDSSADHGGGYGRGEGADHDGIDQGRGPGGRDGAELGKIARGSTLNLVGAGLSAAATLGVTILVTRQFIPSVAGAFFAATSLFLIIENLANLGAYNGVIYFIARLRSPRELAAMIRVAAVPVITVSVTAGCAVFAFAGPLARLLLGGHLATGADPASVAHALRLLALGVPFASLLDTFLGASRGFHDMRPTVLVDRIGRSGAQLAGVGVAALTGATALLAPLWALPYVPAGALAWLWFRRISSRRSRSWPASPSLRPVAPADGAGPGGTGAVAGAASAGDPASHRSATARAGAFWRFTAPRAMATTAQIVIQRLDIVLVGILRGPADAAVYTAATRFLVVGQLGNMAIGMAAQPQLAHLFAVRDRRSANAVYQATTAWLIILTWPLYLLAVIYGPAVLTIFGHSYRAGSGVMVILGLTMLLTTACGQVDVVLTTAGRSSWSLANWLLAVAINVGVDLALIPGHGIFGAAIGWAVALAVMNLVMLAEVGAIVRVSPFGRGCLAASVLAAASFGAVPFGLRMLAGPGPAVSAVAVLLGCAVFAIGLWRLRRTLQLTAMPGLAAVAALAGSARKLAAPAMAAARAAGGRPARPAGGRPAARSGAAGPAAAPPDTAASPLWARSRPGRHRRPRG